jgi:Na+-transporting methylmalonyl-CoA/oxaloacetate decarboxylase gamma subunit
MKRGFFKVVFKDEKGFFLVFSGVQFWFLSDCFLIAAFWRLGVVCYFFISFCGLSLGVVGWYLVVAFFLFLLACCNPFSTYCANCVLNNILPIPKKKDEIEWVNIDQIIKALKRHF